MRNLIYNCYTKSNFNRSENLTYKWYIKLSLNSESEIKVEKKYTRWKYGRQVVENRIKGDTQ